MKDIESITKGILAGDHRALAKGITQVENKRTDIKSDTEKLLASIMPSTGKSLRLGISGVPGVGKSTFIESLGERLVAAGKKIAILAIDPSSPVSGGSIMGDRTRMTSLSANPRVFIRPSPSGGEAGGVARKTRESILLCEAAGFDIVIVETVGVGQGEYLVASMVDQFIILHLPGSGDDLQGIKRGILELADLVIVTKADGDQLTAANLAARQLTQSLHMSSAMGPPPVLTVSCVENTGIDEAQKQIEELAHQAAISGSLTKRRSSQAGSWFEAEVNYFLHDWVFQKPGFEEAHQAALSSVIGGNVPASIAARRLIRDSCS